MCSVVTSRPAASTNFVTAFPTVENPLSQGGIWDRGLQEGLKWTDPKVTANGCVAVSSPTPNRYDDAIAVLKTVANGGPRNFAANQYVQAVLYKAGGYTGGGGAHECELWLRGLITANSATAYECSIGISAAFAVYAFVVRWNGVEGDYTALISPAEGNGSYSNTPTTPANGDVYRAEITGTTIKLYQNGILILQVTDSTYSSGQPGLGFWPVDGATPASMGWSSYTAGDL